MILQVAGSPPSRNVPMIRHLAQQRADVNYRITVTWCVFFFLKGNPGAVNGMEWFWDFFAPSIFLFQITAWKNYIPDISERIFPNFSQSFLEDGTFEGFYLWDSFMQSCRFCPGLDWYNRGVWRWSLGLLLKVRSWYTAWNQQFASIIAPENGFHPERRSNLPIIHFQVRAVSFREGR